MSGTKRRVVVHVCMGIIINLQWEHEEPSPSAEGDAAVYGTAAEIQ